MENKETAQQSNELTKNNIHTHTPVDGYKIEEIGLQDLDSVI